MQKLFERDDLIEVYPYNVYLNIICMNKDLEVLKEIVKSLCDPNCAVGTVYDDFVVCFITPEKTEDFERAIDLRITKPDFDQPKPTI